MNEIVKISHYSEKSARLRIANRLVASKAMPGHFVIIKFTEKGLRVPFSIVESIPDPGFIDIIIHRGDGLDDILKNVREGGVLPDLLGPLGIPAAIEHGKTIVFCGDGPGFVPLLPIIKASRQNGCKVLAIMSEESSQSKCLLGDVYNDCQILEVAPENGVAAMVRKWIALYHPDKFIFSGPTMLMKQLAELTKSYGIPADCVLNMLMIDGIGICGVCRVMVAGKQMQTCIDGPIFNAWDVDFDQMLNRQRSFV